MRSYELRLLDRRGRATVFGFESFDDETARGRILPLLSADEDYQRFELWRGMQLLVRGGRIIGAQIDAADLTDFKLVG